MELALSLPTKANSWEVVKRAEELGYTHAWFYDTELLNAEVFVAMGAAAMKTSRIKLCAGVLIPSNRIAPVAASGLASLNALAPGRIVFGASTGFTARRTLGLGPVTLARLEKYIQVVEGLLQGKTVEWDEEGGTHKIRFLNPELELINIKDPIPTFLSAFGPKARRLTAKLGAGWIGSASYPQREQADLDDMLAAWREKAAIPRISTASPGPAAVCWTRARRPTVPAREPRPVLMPRSLSTIWSNRTSSAPCFRSARIFRSRPSSMPIAKCMNNISLLTPAISAIIAGT